VNTSRRTAAIRYKTDAFILALHVSGSDVTILSAQIETLPLPSCGVNAIDTASRLLLA
jgi:hypothetical protein